jgi:hypothetical protein
VCLCAGMGVLVWALMVYPVAFEYASREGRANFAGGSKLAFASDSFVCMASGWFTICLMLSALLALVSLRLVLEASRWRYGQFSVLTIAFALISVHAIVDGPAYVIHNARSVILAPSSFSYPVDYFSFGIGIRKPGA